MVLQHIYTVVLDRDLHSLWMFLLYSTAFKINSWRQVRITGKLGQKHRFLDGSNHVRDDIPDKGVGQTIFSSNITTQARTIMAVDLTHLSSNTYSLSRWIVVEVVLYQVPLDFYFHIFHRVCHETDTFWTRLGNSQVVWSANGFP